MKIAGMIENFVRCVLKAKLSQQTFMKKRPGCLDTPHLIFKSHKTMCSKKRSLQQFLRTSFSFCILFLPQYMKGRTVLRKNKSYAQSHMGMRLMHEGATSRTARKPVNLLQANRVNVLAIQITDLNQSDHICPIFGMLSAV